ncbi:MAG: DUF3570 domain-containing protein [Chlorobiaceae bacterium]|nr:DUF3570 domain-containing protein [Chlorobiaceae bacterium]
MKSVTKKSTNVIGAALFAAAMALPSSHSAFAEAAPERGIVSFKYLNYEDSQPDAKRIGINANSVTGLVPVAGEWSVGVTLTNDSVSGASPAYHTTNITHMTDLRRAVDLQLTRYFSKGSVTFGTSYSKENDYLSRSYSAQGSLSTEDKNTTVTLGCSITNDDIFPAYFEGDDEKKQTYAGIIGVTKVLTKNDIVQLNVGFSRGSGYFSDPYKWFDSRPRERNSTTILTRWNHHYDGTDGTSRYSYRFYTDSFSITAHTFSAEYVQPLSHEWVVTPELRFYSQTAANFYLPDPIEPSVDAIYYSGDQRLSAFGAITVGIKLAKRIAKEWLVDAKYENYEQRANWSLAGGGDSGLAPFSARSIQLGVSREF